MDLLFILKKIIGHLLMPLPLLLLLFGAALLLLYSRYYRWGRRLTLLAVLVLLLLSIPPLTQPLISAYEQRYPPLNLNKETTAAQAIVILGGGTISTPAGASALAQLSSAASARLSEGVRLAHRYPTLPLIVTGSGVFHNLSNAELYALAAQELGLTANRLIPLTKPNDTEEEGEAIAAQIGRTTPFYLVTSASHMPRAMRIMQQLGLQPIAAPTDYLRSQKQLWIDYLPTETAWDDMRRYWHEQIGMLWLTLRGVD
ncbi:envelope biogenesis factor ElyC [Ectothiorhodospiraceae bacterium BW-2]|nr:envelope biogenesis factor ElyC [Ectothiorhodospiraceae bacterium BW-2]